MYYFVSLIEMMCFGRGHAKCIDVLWLPQCWNPVFLFANLLWIHTGKTTLGSWWMGTNLLMHRVSLCTGPRSSVSQGEHADSKTSFEHPPIRKQESIMNVNNVTNVYNTVNVPIPMNYRCYWLIYLNFLLICDIRSMCHACRATYMCRQLLHIP